MHGLTRFVSTAGLNKEQGSGKQEDKLKKNIIWKWRLKQKLTSVHSDLIWYLFDILQAHKAALLQRIEGEDIDCLELDCTHKIHEQGEQKKKLKKHNPPTTWQNADIIFPTFPIMADKNRWPLPQLEMSLKCLKSQKWVNYVWQSAGSQNFWPQCDGRENWPKMAVERWLWWLEALALNSLCGIFC